MTTNSLNASKAGRALQILQIPIVATVLAMSACATQKAMPFSENARARPGAGQAIFLMSVTQRNEYKPDYQPKLLVAHVERAVVNGRQDRLNFKMDDEGKEETESPETGNQYLVRLELDHGDYVIRGFSSLNHSALINASFFAPLHARLRVAAPGVYYLGHVEATVRERVGNELKAGSSIPLIDQSVAGASGGTFDVAVSDQWQADEARFRSKFPGLAGVAVQKMILPPFDRAVAQKWWEEN